MTKRIMKALEKLLVKKWPQIFDGMNRLGLDLIFLVILGYIYFASSEDFFIPFFSYLRPNFQTCLSKNDILVCGSKLKNVYKFV